MTYRISRPLFFFLPAALLFSATLCAALAEGTYPPVRIVTLPKVLVNGGYLSPQVELFGDVSIGHKVFIAGNTVVAADPGTRVCIGNETNLQDNILFLGLAKTPFPTQAKPPACGLRSTNAGNRVSIAHQAIIDNSTLGDFVFVGFHSRIENSVLENGVFVLHGATVRGVRVGKDRLVPTGAVITTQVQADALPLKAAANSEFQEDVLEVNEEFAESYGATYTEGGFAAVSGVSAAPKTSWNPRPVPPTLGTGVKLEEFARIVGDVRLGAGSLVGRRTSIRADEGAPIIIGAGSIIQDRVTFHALKGTSISIGDRLNAKDNIVFHGPLVMGSGVSVGDDAVVFRSKVGNNVSIGERALVVDVTLRDGVTVPDDAKILTQAAADALK